MKRTSERKANAIAAVEDVDMFATAAAGRFLAWTMCDPVRAGIGQLDETLAAVGELSLGGTCWRGDVNLVDLGPCRTATAMEWEKAIRGAAGGDLVVYTDGSRDQEGGVGGGWYANGNGADSVAVGTIGTVWDWKVAGIHQALRLASEVDVLVLSDSNAALMAVKRTAGVGRGRTGDLVEVVGEVAKRSLLGLSTRLGWVKAHVVIIGNERADAMAKAGCRESPLPQVTECGVHAVWKGIRSREWARVSLGAGRVVHWNRWAVLRYTQLRVAKGDVGGWQRVLGAEETMCRLCGMEEETGFDLVLGCGESGELRPWAWTSWEELDERER